MTHEDHSEYAAVLSINLISPMKLISIILLLTSIGPLWIAMSGKIDFKTSYLDANRESSHLAPNSDEYPDAIIQIYAARAFNWRGIFSCIPLAVKAKCIAVYCVSGSSWHAFRGLPAYILQRIFRS